MFEEMLAGWDGEHVVVRHDRPTGAWMFVSIHSTALGPAGGGTRMRVYPGLEDALADGLRLSAAMTAKTAVAGLPFGGGKGVVAVRSLPVGAERTGLFERYADLLNGLRGSYYAGPDMNTSSDDMDLMSKCTPYVIGRSEACGGGGSTSLPTAIGVVHSIRAALRHVDGEGELDGRSILVQGVGGVGAHLVARLADAGAKVLVSDVDDARVRDLVARTGVVAVDPADVYETPCDVLAPCAVGGILNERSIPRLACRVVAGSANNQLATPGDAARLRDAGVLYAPDFVVSAGGAIHAAGREVLSWSPATIEERLAGIGETLAWIFTEADRRGVTTEEAAGALVRQRLAGGAFPA